MFLPLRKLAIDIKDNGKEIYLMDEERRLGLDLALLLLIEVSMLLGRNMAKGFTRMGKSGGILVNFLTMN